MLCSCAMPLALMRGIMHASRRAGHSVLINIHCRLKGAQSMIRQLVLGISATLIVACQGATTMDQGNICSGIFTDRDGNSVKELSVLSFRQEADLDIRNNKLSILTVPNDFSGAYAPISEGIRDRFHSINRNDLNKMIGYEIWNSSRFSMKGVDVLQKDARACAPELELFKDYARGYNDIVVQHLLDRWDGEQRSRLR